MEQWTPQPSIFFREIGNLVLVVVGIVAEVVLLFVLLFLSLFVHVTGGFSRRIVIVVVAVHGYGYF